MAVAKEECGQGGETKPLRKKNARDREMGVASRVGEGSFNRASRRPTATGRQ
jgi:hypothetical protein